MPEASPTLHLPLQGGGGRCTNVQREGKSLARAYASSRPHPAHRRCATLPLQGRVRLWLFVKNNGRGITPAPANPERQRPRIDPRPSPVQPLAIIRARIGLSTKIARPTTAKFMIAVATNTMCQLPVASLIRLAIGTRNAEVPFAV